MKHKNLENRDIFMSKKTKP